MLAAVSVIAIVYGLAMAANTLASWLKAERLTVKVAMLPVCKVIDWRPVIPDSASRPDWTLFGVSRMVRCAGRAFRAVALAVASATVVALTWTEASRPSVCSVSRAARLVVTAAAVMPAAVSCTPAAR